MGEVTVVATARDLSLGVALAERADAAQTWYGLGRQALGRLTLAVVRGQASFDTVARGRVPGWSAGVTYPGTGLVVIRPDRGDPFQILRHELAHVALHRAVRGRVPLWFDEGYAVVAAGEFGRFEGIRLNLAVARGRIPDLDLLDRDLRDQEETAETAYALAGAAVLFLGRKNPSGTIEPLLDQLQQGVPFADAVERTTGLNLGRLDEAWQRDLKHRYGLGLWLLAGGGWTILAVLIIGVAWWRKRRDRPRRAALDEGWIVPTENEDEEPEGPALDPKDGRP